MNYHIAVMIIRQHSAVSSSVASLILQLATKSPWCWLQLQHGFTVEVCYSSSNVLFWYSIPQKNYSDFFQLVPYDNLKTVNDIFTPEVYIFLRRFSFLSLEITLHYHKIIVRSYYIVQQSLAIKTTNYFKGRSFLKCLWMVTDNRTVIDI